MLAGKTTLSSRFHSLLFPSQQRPKFLILLPIHRPPEILPYAISSVMQQTEQDFQLHIISDGAPDETTDELIRVAKTDRRITAHIFPKGKRNGEAYRDPIIRETNADFVCQIADDDIWFPNHLSEVEQLLRNYDFGHTIQTLVTPDEGLKARIGDLSDPDTISKMLNREFNLFGPTASGYKVSAYLRLEEGWTAAPDDVWTDLFMWRKFLRQKGISTGSRWSFTNINLAASCQLEYSVEERAAINKEWWQTISDPDQLDDLIQALNKHLLVDRSSPWLRWPETSEP
ncbi:MAG: glycosyltransferase family A protein [Pseudomonadota bacterium]